MNQKTGQMVGAFAGVILAAMVGCAGNGYAPPEWQEVTTFSPSDDLPRIVVYGSLAPHLPRFNPTPALDEFLYGPAPIENTYLRNPQGLTMLGPKLLVCDQGYPDVVSINLATGVSDAWQERDRSPRCPVAITAGDDGMVYVADTTLRAVLVYSPTGGFVEQLVAGEENAPGFRPAALCIHNGILHVGNIEGRRVDRWSISDRRWLSPLGQEADGPGLIAPTGLAATPDGVLLVADSIRGRVFRLSPEGEWLRPIGRPGRQDGEFVRPKQVSATPSGLVFVTDAGRQSVMVFTANGDFVTEIHEKSNEWRGFTLPTGLLALPADGLAVLMPEGEPVPEPSPDEWVIVSDSLSGSSLNLLGIFLPSRMEGADHAAE